MNCIRLYSFVLIVSLSIISCTSHRPLYNPNVGTIEIQIMAVGNSDGTVQLENGLIIGHIDKNLNIYDSNGKKIGFRKPRINEE